MKRPTLNRLQGDAPSRQNPEKFSDNADRMMTYLAGMPDDLDGMIDYNEGLLEKIEEHEVSSAASKVSAASSAEKVAETEKDIIQREANVEQKAQEAAASAKTAGQLAQAVGANVDAATSAQRASDKALAAAASETKAAASAKEAQTYSKALATHTDQTDNPHNVTAAQVGAYTTGQTAEAIAQQASEAGPPLRYINLASGNANAKGFVGAFGDANQVYFVPYNNGAPHGLCAVLNLYNYLPNTPANGSI